MQWTNRECADLESSRRLTTRTAIVVSSAFVLCWAPTRAKAVTVDPVERTVTSAAFFVDWSNGASDPPNPEEISVLTWDVAGDGNLTLSKNPSGCASGLVEFFGNSWAPPVWGDGGVLVGSGSVPIGVEWDVAYAGKGVIIESQSTECPPYSLGASVRTKYRFWDMQSRRNMIGVKRVFYGTALDQEYGRPYLPRLRPSDEYAQVLYPSVGGELATIDVRTCSPGCTEPELPGSAILLSPPWDREQGWYAIHNPETEIGLLVRRYSNDMQVQLWVDHDGGTDSNATSFLLVNHEGFAETVREMYLFSFYDGFIWPESERDSLVLPPGFPERCDW